MLPVDKMTAGCVEGKSENDQDTKLKKYSIMIEVITKILAFNRNLTFYFFLLLQTHELKINKSLKMLKN